MEQEKLYDIYMNDEGEILIAIKVRDGEPVDPKIIYDGQDLAVFYRDPEHTIALDYIHPQVRVPLTKVSSLVIAELDKDKDGGKPKEEQEPVREYEVAVKILPRLPVTTKDLPEHLSDEEEEALAKLDNWEIPEEENKAGE